MKLALLMVIALLESGTALAQSTGTSETWELKGLRLGMPADEVKSTYPASECEQLALGVELCVDKTATFAGGPAHLVTKFLDGRLISITVNHITRNQATSAAQGLIAKFGDATKVTTKWKYVEADDKMQNVTTHLWLDGDVLIFVDPLDLYLPKSKTQYSAVRLSDRAKHDGAWLPRANAPKTAPATDL